MGLKLHGSVRFHQVLRLSAEPFVGLKLLDLRWVIECASLSAEPFVGLKLCPLQEAFVPVHPFSRTLCGFEANSDN